MYILNVNLVMLNKYLFKYLYLGICIFRYLYVGGLIRSYWNNFIIYSFLIYMY